MPHAAFYLVVSIPLLLLGGWMLGWVYNAIQTGTISGQHGTTYRDVNPRLFWFGVAVLGFAGALPCITGIGMMVWAVAVVVTALTR